MSRARASLLARRRELLLRAESQRVELGEEFDRVGRTFLGAERVLRVVDTLEGKVPQLAVGAAIAALLFGPARLTGWAGSAWMVWQAVRGLIAAKRRA